MHGMHDQVDIRRFGGLWRHMPVTFGTFRLGYLALIGFPFLSGFFTKDPIIEAAFDRGRLAGLDARRRRAARRRADRVLHDPADAHDVLRPERWRDLTRGASTPRTSRTAGALPPARVAAGR